jgi:ubiquinone/menaquinone biosynthesis C-methylase UbiE
MNSEQFYRQRIIYSPSELREAVIRLLKRRVSVEYLLDVGCSDGSFTYSIASAVGAKEIYGVDISEKAVAEALRRGIKAFKINVDVENLPFPDN